MLVDRLLRGLSFVYAYTDDLLVASSTAEEQMEHLATVLDRLQQFGFVFNQSRCVFCVPSTEFLGHLVNSHGIHPLPLKVAAIHALAAIDKVKAALADTALLTHVSPDVPISFMVDASSVAVGAVLQQHPTGHTQPLTFYFKKLSPAETRYSTVAQELLAVFLAVKHFRHFLEGRDFTVFTDYKPLSLALKSTTDKPNPQEICQRDYISQFTSGICHIDESRNEVADALSRPSIAHFQLSPGLRWLPNDAVLVHPVTRTFPNSNSRTCD
nr:unnamed protein product [Spirometra erinaceieuropaei]